MGVGPAWLYPRDMSVMSWPLASADRFNPSTIHLVPKIVIKLTNPLLFYFSPLFTHSHIQVLLPLICHFSFSASIVLLLVIVEVLVAALFDLLKY